MAALVEWLFHSFYITIITFIYLEKRVYEPSLIEEIDVVSQYGTKVHLQCASQDATIFYTLDGTLPTRRFPNVLV